MTASNHAQVEEPQCAHITLLNVSFAAMKYVRLQVQSRALEIQKQVPLRTSESAQCESRVREFGL